MKETILVTGGTGFIGSHTTVELQQAGYDVVIIDNLSNSNAAVVDGIEKITGIRPAFEQVDLNDYAATEAVFQKYQTSSLQPPKDTQRGLREYTSRMVKWARSPSSAGIL